MDIAYRVARIGRELGKELNERFAASGLTTEQFLSNPAEAAIDKACKELAGLSIDIRQHLSTQE